MKARKYCGTLVREGTEVINPAIMFLALSAAAAAAATTCPNMTAFRYSTLAPNSTFAALALAPPIL